MSSNNQYIKKIVKARWKIGKYAKIWPKISRWIIKKDTNKETDSSTKYRFKGE